MNKFSRTVEKVLAWIANVILILVTIFFTILKFSGVLNELENSNEFRTAFKASLMESGQAMIFTDSEIDLIINSVMIVLNTYTIGLVILTILALVASFTMKKRIFSGILFLILSIVILAISFGSAFIVYVPYFVVAIMLFVRKEPVDYYDDFTQNKEVDKVEYV